MSKPKMVEVQVCDTCGEPWSDHVLSAINRDKTRWYLDPDHVDDDHYDPYPAGRRDVTVTKTDCIQALKRRNQGPQGEMGAMGAPGPQGPTGRPGQDYS